MPVITIACGAGSRRRPARAVSRDNPEDQENPAADQVEGEKLAQRLRVDDEAVKTEPDQRRADEPGDRRGAHRLGLRGSAAPRPASAASTAIVSIMKASMNEDDRLGETGGIGEEAPAIKGPARPTARKIAGPATSARLSQRAPIRGGSASRAIIASIPIAARIAPA